MNAARAIVVGAAALVATAAFAGEYARNGASAPSAEAPAWEFAISAYPTAVRGGDNYTSAIATADHGALHLEARYNYESIGARSLFIGWNLSGGETLTWELTPLVGGAWGTTQAFVPGLEASIAWGPLDAYIEAEYVHADDSSVDNYTYAWSELGYRPAEWLRVGLAGQRTRIYGGDRDIQRGPFAQITVDHVTIGGYWFNPGASDQIFVGLISVAF